MPFMDPQTGEVFNTIRDAVENYRCPGPCADCPLGQKVAGINGCVNGKWFDDHPIDTARLMGYEVIDDVGAGSEPTRPRLAEVLGVDEDEKWRYPECAGLYRVHNGVREYWDENNGWLPCDCEEDLIRIVAHPELIIRLPRLTEPEIERCRAHGAKWVSRDKRCDDGGVDLWRKKPLDDNGMYVNTPDNQLIATVYISELFPSLKPGDCIGVEEAAHALKNPG